jgi:ribosomal protein S18
MDYKKGKDFPSMNRRNDKKAYLQSKNSSVEEINMKNTGRMEEFLRVKKRIAP